MTRPPIAALVLGYSGLLPPLAGGAVAWWLRGSSDRGVIAFIVVLPVLCYAALILSFLGGIWWGAASAKIASQRLWPWLILAVMPSLVAAAAFLTTWVTPPPLGIAGVLALGLLVSLMVDRLLVRERIVPDWWMWLRAPLSIGLALETLAVALLA